MSYPVVMNNCENEISLFQNKIGILQHFISKIMNGGYINCFCIGVPFSYAPIFQYAKGGINKRNILLRTQLGLCSTSFSMYCGTQGVYRNGMGVFVVH